ncbi:MULTISPECIES: alpha/beta hydrolase [unclassified Bifidobacterium]|uniref:alpha/beta fold hydrolase n=1 Tax=unclassified Bifidobacterium TaxID=2608897 RepID=UPI0023F7285D|nr:MULTISPECIES: alpha/beta hydrolase [unclassified Bifidobacterium]WEV65544.1 alpha/beta hydrolase [Bifidobacterium sp. ESL0764]WEV75651.1 alpha/beta hydrolase [Bifidobacterium sp. ESL0800]
MNIRIGNKIYRSGKGTPLILLHAFPVDARMWDDCAASLIRLGGERGMAPFPIWAPDTPGAGDAAIPDASATGALADDGAYVEAMDKVVEAYVSMLHVTGHEKAIWVGLSMGGYLAMDIQRLFPGSVAGLALCDTTTLADSHEARANRLNIAKTCEDDNTVEPVMHFARPQAGDSSIKRSPHFEDLLSGWIRDQRPEGLAWRERMAAGRADTTDLLPHITAPAAVVCGENDPSSPPAKMRPIADAMTSTSVAFTAIPDCGHFSAVEHPDALANALLDLVQRVERR